MHSADVYEPIRPRGAGAVEGTVNVKHLVRKRLDRTKQGAKTGLNRARTRLNKITTVYQD